MKKQKFLAKIRKCKDEPNRNFQIEKYNQKKNSMDELNSRIEGSQGSISNLQIEIQKLLNLNNKEEID